jgi:hypothetical protein
MPADLGIIVLTALYANFYHHCDTALLLCGAGGCAAGAGIDQANPNTHHNNYPDTNGYPDSHHHIHSTAVNVDTNLNFNLDFHVDSHRNAYGDRYSYGFSHADFYSDTITDS